jgi:hypothetical protein
MSEVKEEKEVSQINLKVKNTVNESILLIQRMVTKLNSKLKLPCHCPNSSLLTTRSWVLKKKPTNFILTEML